jgi:hypothetical protein
MPRDPAVHNGGVPGSRPQAAELPLELVDELEELDEPEEPEEPDDEDEEEEEEDVEAAGFESDDLESEAFAPDVAAGELLDDDPRLSFR